MWWPIVNGLVFKNQNLLIFALKFPYQKSVKNDEKCQNSRFYWNSPIKQILDLLKFPYWFSLKFPYQKFIEIPLSKPIEIPLSKNLKKFSFFSLFFTFFLIGDFQGAFFKGTSESGCFLRFLKSALFDRFLALFVTFDRGISIKSYMGLTAQGKIYWNSPINPWAISPVDNRVENPLSN